jgi:hypothetical protein
MYNTAEVYSSCLKTAQSTSPLDKIYFDSKIIIGNHTYKDSKKLLYDIMHCDDADSYSRLICFFYPNLKSLSKYPFPKYKYDIDNVYNINDYFGFTDKPRDSKAIKLTYKGEQKNEVEEEIIIAFYEVLNEDKNGKVNLDNETIQSIKNMITTATRLKAQDNIRNILGIVRKRKIDKETGNVTDQYTFLRSEVSMDVLKNVASQKQSPEDLLWGKQKRKFIREKNKEFESTLSAQDLTIFKKLVIKTAEYAPISNVYENISKTKAEIYEELAAEWNLNKTNIESLERKVYRWYQDFAAEDIIPYIYEGEGKPRKKK